MSAPNAPQPAKAIAVMLGVTNRDIAQRLDVSEHWVGRVLNGRVHAPERFRRGLAELFGLRVDMLFRCEP